MALIPGILPPSRPTWELITKSFQFFPLFAAAQWITPWYPAGKTSTTSPLNLPGKWAWTIMESPTILIMTYVMLTLPAQEGLSSLPWGNWTMAGLYVLHYIYRAWLSPLLLNPSMSPIHFFVAAGAFAFNTLNALSIGGWLGGYGPRTVQDWAGHLYAMEIGLVLWGWSFMANIFHDDDLREIRRSAARRQREQAEKEGKPVEGVEKLYMIPKNGLFRYILFPHYLCEWFEWAAYWMIGGWGCVPARTFLVNEVSTMLPRAVQGKGWYVEKFGEERVGGRKAVIPGLI
ncbi:uncharacterized protein LTR77_004214 [Saxophila tyrrhenica]|uniref:3-oxo-5-alpha-steroid 4-dehydrogenase C-terminal domain-containing protein n=1 Tax=Saxophila tyrrhenica TaxID=1690608 RepID=A0AAV9PF98_9PEZI|nr:hypothetical protein LTR77_004214 [Saxophila tyrrhenica]